MKEEIWKDVPNYEGIYKVSDLGNIKSLLSNKIMKQSNTNDGYLCISLMNKGKRWRPKIHQIVAMAFLGHIPCGMKMVIDHINDNPLDNRVENLQIVTTRYNSNKTQGKYSSKYKGVSWNCSRLKWVARIHINGETKHLGAFVNEYDAHLAYENELKTIIT